jgi:tetratricopeptide (TPR) repeat protein
LPKSKPSDSTQRRFLLGVALLALAAVLLRAAFLVADARALPFLRHPVLDAALFRDQAALLARGLPFTQGPYYQAPGYPIFLGLVFRVFGVEPVAAVLLQAALGTATVVLTAFLGRRLFGAAAGILAGALLLVYAPLYFYEAKLLGTALAVFLTVGSVLLSVRAEAARKPRTLAAFAFGAGLAAGVLGVVRSNLLLLPAIVAAVYAWRAVRGRAPGRLVLAYAAGAFLAVIPVSAHNVVHGAWTPLATSGGFNFYTGNFRGATGVLERVPGVSDAIRTQEADADSVVRAALGRPVTPTEASRWWFRRATSDIAASPGRWLLLEARKVWMLVGRQEETVNGSFPVEASKVALLHAFALPFNLLAGLGLFGLVLAVRAGRRAPPRKRSTLAAPIAVLVAVLATGMLFFVMSRLRLPAVPVLAVFSGYALVRGSQAWRARRQLGVGIAALGILVFTGLTWRSPLGANRNPLWEARLFVHAGEALEKDGNPAGAMHAYREALARNPGSVGAHLHLGQLEAARGNVPGAIGELEAALRGAPDDPSILANLGILYYAAGRADDCQRVMIEASRLDPRAAAPYLYRGLLMRARHEPGALDMFRAALERDPRLPSAYAGLIEGLLEAGRNDEARTWVEKAVRAGVQLPPALTGRLH